MVKRETERPRERCSAHTKIITTRWSSSSSLSHLLLAVCCCCVFSVFCSFDRAIRIQSVWHSVRGTVGAICLFNTMCMHFPLQPIQMRFIDYCSDIINFYCAVAVAVCCCCCVCSRLRCSVLFAFNLFISLRIWFGYISLPTKFSSFFCHSSIWALLASIYLFGINQAHSVGGYLLLLNCVQDHWQAASICERLKNQILTTQPLLSLFFSVQSQK